LKAISYEGTPIVTDWNWDDEKSPIVVADDTGIRKITLNRPARLNAMQNDTFDGLRDILIASSLDTEIKCVVLTGAGRGFCAGWNLDEMQSRPVFADGKRHGAVPCIEELVRFNKPLIAAVNGVAVGFGATLTLHADIAIGSSEARLRFPFTELGLAGESAVSATLPSRVGYQEAARLLFTCDWIDANDAARLGLIWRVVAPADLLPTAMSLGSRIAQMPLESLVATKQLLFAAKASPVLPALDREVAMYARLMGGPSNLKAIEDFKNRRASRGSLASTGAG
jgi:enoyl-CoA hydratase/carnithine racemase